MNNKTETEKTLVGSILLIVLGIVLLVLGIVTARTFYGYHFGMMNIALIGVGIFWLIGGAYYGVKVYKAKQMGK